MLLPNIPKTRSAPDTLGNALPPAPTGLEDGGTHCPAFGKVRLWRSEGGRTLLGWR